MSTPVKDSDENLSEKKNRAYWRANIRVMTTLLSIWAVIAYGLGLIWVEELNSFQMGGFPFGFWVGHQGAMYVFVVLVLVYAFWMDRLDKIYGVDK